MEDEVSDAESDYFDDGAHHNVEEVKEREHDEDTMDTD